MDEETELLIYSEIGPAMFGMVDDVMVIDVLNSMQDARKISIRLNSPGGDAFMGVSIMNALKRHPAKITVHVDALAASAASIIAMGGDRVIMHEGSMMMIHRAWTIGMGNAQEFFRVGDLLNKVDENLVDIYNRKSGLDKAKVKQMMESETWMRADEAHDLGLADSTDSVSSGAKACVPHRWFNRVPDKINRYSLNDPTRIAAMCGLKIAVKAKQEPNPQDAALFEAVRKRIGLVK